MTTQTHIMLSALTLGDGVSAPLAEIAACAFDPDTGEITPEWFGAVTNLRKEVKDGHAMPDRLANFMRMRRQDLNVFHRTSSTSSAAKAVEDLGMWIDGLLSSNKASRDHLKIYVMQPHTVLPRIQFLHHEVLGEDDGMWPEYGVVCAKTIQDLAHPLMVEHCVNVPVRPASHSALSAECNWQAVVTMHSLLLLRGLHPNQMGTPAKAKKLAKPTVPADDDDEL